MLTAKRFAVVGVQVLLRFHSSFPGHNPGHHVRVTNRRLYNVRFSIKRSTLVFMHEAVALLRTGVLDGSFVLPGTVPAKLALGGDQPNAPQVSSKPESCRGAASWHMHLGRHDSHSSLEEA